MSGTVGGYIETARFPSDTDGLVPHPYCSRCRGSVIGEGQDLFCLACGCRFCPTCGSQMIADLCPICLGKPLPLKYNAGEHISPTRRTIDKLRREGLKQIEIARRIGISRQRVHQILSHRYRSGPITVEEDGH